jgi:hypothetical protein
MPLESEIQLLELAIGIKDSLISAGFITIGSILNSTITDISFKVGVAVYITNYST